MLSLQRGAKLMHFRRLLVIDKTEPFRELRRAIVLSLVSLALTGRGLSAIWAFSKNQRRYR
jgi:hypothetical protein